jgi:hypothetical protein
MSSRARSFILEVSALAKLRKPRKTPAQLAAEALAKRAVDLESVNLHPDAAGLPLQQDIEVTRAGQAREGRKVDGNVARRLDAFDALRPSMAGYEFAGCYDAARRLERDLMIRYGQHDHGRPVDRVDCEQAAFNRNDLMIMAGERIDAVMDRLSPREGRLLQELIVPSRDWGHWRRVVAHVTAESNMNAQGAAVRAACVSLRDAYVRLDVASRRAA